MGLFVTASLYVVTRYAGGWGVPYFSFTSERGSHCTNDFAGYTCDAGDPRPTSSSSATWTCPMTA